MPAPWPGNIARPHPVHDPQHGPTRPMKMKQSLALAMLLAAVLIGPALSQPRHEDLARVVPLPTGYDVDMVLIPAGSFPRGMEGEEFDEQPVREIYLDAYLIDKYEVTAAQWNEYQQDTGAMLPEWTLQSGQSRRDHPIVFVTWQDAHDFCEWAGKRLPSEAEWERAARCDDGRKYPWGDGLDAFRANFFESFDPYERSVGTILATTPVGFFDGSLRDGFQTRSGASPFGVHDMVGNVWEWTNDWYHSSYYADGPTENPTGPEIGVVKSVRGGSYAVDASHVRPTYRARDDPILKGPEVGFRCASDVPQTAVSPASWGEVKESHR